MVPRSLHRLWLTVILLTTLSMVLSSLSPFVAADPLRGDETETSLEQSRDSNATLEGDAPEASGEEQAGESGQSEDEQSGGGTETGQEECLAEAREKIGDAQGGDVACPREVIQEGSGDAGSAENGEPPKEEEPCEPGQKVNCPPGGSPGGKPPTENGGPGNTGLTNRDTGFPVYVSKAWVDEYGSPLDPAQMPDTTIVVTINGTDYTFDCTPAGVNPVDCGSVVLPSRPTSISVTEPDLGDEWVPVVPDVRECFWDSADECRIEITNWRNGPYTIRVWKYWVDLLWNPVGTNQISSTTITVWVDGQAYTLTCPGNSNPDPCGEISLDRWPGSVVVDEPSVPSGWEVVDWTTGDQTTNCTSQGNPCYLNVVNRQEGMLLYALKFWFSGIGGNFTAGPQTYVQITVDGFPLVLTCPATGSGWAFCGPLAIPGRPTTIIADEPWLPAYWAYYSGAGDYSSSCAGQDYCGIFFINVRDEQRREGSSPEGLYVVDVQKEWLSDGQHTSDHPTTWLELTIEQGGQSVTLLLSCAANQPSPQSCGSVTLTQRPDRVVVAEPGVPDDWQPVPATVTVDNCPQQGPCVVTFTNQQNTGGSGGGGSGGSGGGGSGGSGGGGGGGTGSGGEDEPVVEEPPPPGTPENPSQGGGSGGPTQGVGQQPPAQQPAERAEATYQGQDWSIEDERLSEALRERKKVESEELQVIQLLPRTGRGVEAVLPASAVGLLVMATLLAGLALVWGSRARYRTAVGGAGERGAAGGAGRSGSDPARPPLGGRHWSARGRGRPPVR
jgi:uncharacterized membrane protein YgcG